MTSNRAYLALVERTLGATADEAASRLTSFGRRFGVRIADRCIDDYLLDSIDESGCVGRMRLTVPCGGPDDAYLLSVLATQDTTGARFDVSDGGSKWRHCLISRQEPRRGVVSYMISGAISGAGDEPATDPLAWVDRLPVPAAPRPPEDAPIVTLVAHLVRLRWASLRARLRRWWPWWHAPPRARLD